MVNKLFFFVTQTEVVTGLDLIIKRFPNKIKGL